MNKNSVPAPCCWAPGTLQYGAALWLSPPLSQPTDVHTYKTHQWLNGIHLKVSCVCVHTLTRGTGFGDTLTRLRLASTTSVSPASRSRFLYAAVASVFCWRYGPKLGRLYRKPHPPSRGYIRPTFNYSHVIKHFFCYRKNLKNVVMSRS